MVKDGEEGEWGTVARGLTLHDQGGRALLTTKDDPPRNLKLELEQRVYAGERRVEVLKIAVYEEGNDESLSYSWAAPDSTNVGMNLRWFQAGCTRE